MQMTVDALTLDLLAWIAREPRTYADAMDAWSSHCPRLLIWEDALTAGLVGVVRNGAAGSTIALTPRGAAALAVPLQRQTL